MLRVATGFPVGWGVLPRVVSVASIVTGGSVGKTWKYDPDFEPTEPCLRAGLRGNPYGTRIRGSRQLKGQVLFRPALNDPVWKDVRKLLEKFDAPKDFLKLHLPAVVPEFPVESKRANPYWQPGNHPTIRNAYEEQRRKIVQQNLEKQAEERQAKRLRHVRRWARERARNAYFKQELNKAVPSYESLDANQIAEETKKLEAAVSKQ